MICENVVNKILLFILYIGCSLIVVVVCWGFLLTICSYAVNIFSLTGILSTYWFLLFDDV